MSFKIDDSKICSSAEASSEDISQSASSKDSRRTHQLAYVPVAFVLSTELENHDIFRDILLELFESIRTPKRYTNKCLQDKKLAFSDVLLHVAYLRTLPAPSYNSKMLVEFRSKTLILQEKSLNRIPHRNTIAIETLFEILDVRSILYMWKAMLFDYTLVLISSQMSLQFYVAEALKQLIFPLVWSHSYIQPANLSLMGYAESPMPVLFCCSPYD